MNDQILITYIYTSNNYLNQGINRLLLKNSKNPKAFIDYSKTIDDVYQYFKVPETVRL